MSYHSPDAGDSWPIRWLTEDVGWDQRLISRAGPPLMKQKVGRRCRWSHPTTQVEAPQRKSYGQTQTSRVPFSLFAFQDIIKSVTGIILLITMMMAVELVQNLSRAAAAPQEEKSSQVAHTLRQAVSESTSEMDRLQKILDETTTIRFNADSLRRRLAELKAAAGELELQNEQILTSQISHDAAPSAPSAESSRALRRLRGELTNRAERTSTRRQTRNRFSMRSPLSSFEREFPSARLSAS